MIVYPNGKINLGLNVIEKREDGYHNISSVFYPVKELFDILEIIPSNLFSFESSGVTIPGEKNICTQAYELLKADFGINSVKIHLHKQIPIGAGLGGGSANGAFTLVALSQLFDLKLSKEQLEKYALQLGADCPFFIENTPKYVNGIGEKMSSVDLDLTSFELKFIFPELHISTAEAYAGIIPQLPATNLLNLITQPLENWKGKVKNDFEISAFVKHPTLKVMKKQLYADGAIYASMSGSGSVLYGIFSL
ncbi:MAG: 4-(cytidine 5'-diphospho)-2-C-methyl-D-erythritol kinase [Bacteroidota bacterium]|nr:4-(cytidine 5'-diphospho)-2-C-methyl-D-erythritol kinase [Bacteroidota bacterium]